MIKISDVNVINKNISFETLTGNVESIVDGSFDSNGRYHEYLREYCFASTVLKLFTDYNGTYDFEEVMVMYHDYSSWNTLTKEIERYIAILAFYVEQEITDRRNPFADVSEIVNRCKGIVNKLDKAVDKLDTEKIMRFINNLDVDAVNKFSKLLGG